VNSGVPFHSKKKRLPRIAGHALQRIREAHFRRHPLCVHCEAKGITRLAVQLDHIVAIVNGGKETHSNRQGLCIECHKVKTLLDLGLKVRPTIGLDGFPIEDT